MIKYKLTVNYNDLTERNWAVSTSTLLHLAKLHFSSQCINVNSSKFNNISVINVLVMRMYQHVGNILINVSNKECSNIDLKLRKKKNNLMRERKKVPFINFFV